MEVDNLAELLHETAQRHDVYEKASEPHDWWDWYAAYLNARLQGSTTDVSSEMAGRYMSEVKNVSLLPHQPVSPLNP